MLLTERRASEQSLPVLPCLNSQGLHELPTFIFSIAHAHQILFLPQEMTLATHHESEKNHQQRTKESTPVCITVYVTVVAIVT